MVVPDKKYKIEFIKRGIGSPNPWRDICITEWSLPDEEGCWQRVCTWACFGFYNVKKSPAPSREHMKRASWVMSKLLETITYIEV